MLFYMVFALFVSFIGGLLAFLLHLSIPWLTGSLLIIVLCRKVKFIQSPPKIFSRWMRVILGVALGASVSESLQSFNTSYVSLVAVVIAFVSFVSLVGFYYFKRLPLFSSIDAFMSSLPGGLTFLMSLSDDLGERFPRIALIHTVRMVFVIVCFSAFAFMAGVGSNEQILHASFAISTDPMLWQVAAFTFVLGSLADRLNIAGGHIIFPMIASAIFFTYGLIAVPVPEIFVTFAMVTFGVGIGFKLNKVSFKEFKPYVKASLLSSVFAMLMAFLIAVFLGKALDMHYFLFFLALAPGSIAEISLIALALGFDVGIVAMVHTCRYLFIMFIGASGLNILTSKEQEKHQQAEKLAG